MTEPVGSRQLTAISGALAKHGVKTRPHRLAIVSALAGRTLQSTKDLTRREARSILEHIGQLNAIGELDMLVDQHRPAVTE
jgi:hypothetical protein